MHLFRTIAITTGVVLAILFGAYNYMPVTWLDWLPAPQKENLGATITTILGSDTLRDSRAVINTNFANLNSDKIETSTTTLPNITTLSSLSTVGTITTGTWNADTLTVPFGGTGSTTLSAFHVLLGNGASSIDAVASLGTSGQALVSNGVGAAPTWQSVAINEGSDYTWTGTNSWSGASTFTGTTTIAATSTAPLVLRGVSYVWPSADGSAGTFIQTDGSGNLTWAAASAVNEYSSNDTWNKPTGAVKVFVQLWGGGASGAKNSGGVGGGGGGGAYTEMWFDAADLGSSESVTVGAGGAAKTSNGNGNDGGNSSFGSHVTAYGGQNGSSGGDGGGGGGITSAGSGATGGDPFPGATSIFGGGTGGSAGDGGASVYGGGGGADGNNTGGGSVYGGAGGGGGDTNGTGGTSTYGGNGGDDGAAGTAPGGGGGGSISADSGAGGAGKVIVTTFF